MKVIAAIQADLKTSSIGTRSRLADEIEGVCILRRTVERVLLAKRVEAVYVLCPASQFERCASLLEGTAAEVRHYDAGPPPWGPLTQSARKWSLDGWRGGIGGTTCFDEYTDCRLLSGLIKTVEAEHVLSVPPAAPLIDPQLADTMIEHREGAEEDLGVTFTQAPPGLSGVLLKAGFVHELAEKGVPLGWVFSYQPDNPRKDVIFQACCVEIPAELRHATGRLIGDTDRSVQTLTELLHDHRDRKLPDLASIGRRLSERNSMPAHCLPREVEVELTTDDPYPDTLLRPRGRRVQPRGPIDPGTVAKVVAEMARFDDALIVLGGFGDPLRHPQFTSILEAIRAAPAPGRRLYGLAIRTTAVDLSDELIETLIAHEVDIASVVLDALTPELYGRVQSPNDPAAASLETVLGKLDRVSQLRQQHMSAKPIILPEITKARDNIHELDEFYDGWMRRIGAATISGYSHFAGQCEDRSVIRMAPTTRHGCRRIHSRCLVLADGRVVICDQDLHAQHAVGSLHEHSLEEIWNAAAFERIREAHRRGQFDPTPLCAACDEWHRP
ncbi:MAG: radical SAM/SPASM domain-containing protein [Planctomycetota bacterium]|jgi:spiro-SPASM protein